MSTSQRPGANRLAERLLGDALPDRFSHVQSTSAQADSQLSGSLTNGTLELVAVSGVLHDIGYSSEIAEVGFHPLDGARFLRSEGWDESVVNLVANHSCAEIEADLRGLGDDLRSEFPKDQSLPHDELCFCDMTTGPKGQLMTVDERLADINSRYGPDSIVQRFIESAGLELRASVSRVQARIASS